tara:strand:+ start:43 stop:312 length:270 start_codon:yes stop_codon:yes gene_type:complete
MNKIIIDMPTPKLTKAVEKELELFEKLQRHLSDGELLDNVIQYLEQVLEDTPPLLAYLSRDRKNHLYVSAHARFDLVRDLLNKITKEFK